MRNSFAYLIGNVASNFAHILSTNAFGPFGRQTKGACGRPVRFP